MPQIWWWRRFGGVVGLALLWGSVGTVSASPLPWGNPAVKQALQWVAGHKLGELPWTVNGPARVYPPGTVVSALARAGAGVYQVALMETPRVAPLNSHAARRGRAYADWHVMTGAGRPHRNVLEFDTGLWMAPRGWRQTVRLGSRRLGATYATEEYREAGQLVVLHEPLVAWQQDGWLWQTQGGDRYAAAQAAREAVRAVADVKRLPAPAGQGVGVIRLDGRDATICLSWTSRDTVVTFCDARALPTGTGIRAMVAMAASWAWARP
jgi:hypothetical protein